MASQVRVPRQPWWAAHRGGSPWSGPRWRPATRACGGLSPGSAARHQPLQPPCPAGTQICKTRAWVPPAPRGQACGPTQRVRSPLPPSVPPRCSVGPLGRLPERCCQQQGEQLPPDSADKSHSYSLPGPVGRRFSGSVSGLWAGCRPGWGRRLPQTLRRHGEAVRGSGGAPGQEGCFHVAPGAHPARHHLLRAQVAMCSRRMGLCQPPLGLTLWTGEAGGGGRRRLLPGPPAGPVRPSQWTFLPPPLYPLPMSSAVVPFLPRSFPRVQGWGLGWSPPLPAAGRARA